MNQHASMNRIYRLIWSEVQGAWVPVAETARARVKSRRARAVMGRSAVAAAISLALAPLGHAAAPPAPAAAPSTHGAGPCAGPSCGPPSLSTTSHPLGGKVVSGSASISQVGNTTEIHQSSTDVAIDWLSFDIGTQSSVDFVQPSAAAVAVNRISGGNGSEILGHLDANGQVYLINPNGVLFGKGAEVNVGGLVASTLDVGEGSGSSRSFSGAGTGSVVNQGTITAGNGGYVALIGNRVSNEGVITAQLGTVALGSGSAVTLDFNGDRLMHLEVDRSTLNDLAENRQLIEADGGVVIMTAGAQRSLLASVVNNTGIIEARTVENHEGTIELVGGMSAGTVQVGGTLDASAPHGGCGGHIETDAAHVQVSNDAKVTSAAAQGLTGSWLIDPQDFTVAASGGDITGAALSKELTTTSVALESSAGAKAGRGNVNINDTVSWYANTNLTLTASNNVNVNKNITAQASLSELTIDPNTANGSEKASGTGTFNLGAGAAITLSGSDAGLSIGTANYTLGTGAQIYLPDVSASSTTALVIGGVSYTVINSLGAAGSTSGTDLQGIKPSGHYALGSNIDASATATWNSNGAASPVYAGFTPIGTAATPFTGTLEGLGHTISGLSIDRPTTSDVGLIGRSGKTALIRDVGLVGGSVTGASYVGAVAGQSGGTVSESYATGNVSGAATVGGLLGESDGAVSASYATGNVTGSGNGVGGLVGQSDAALSASYATGNTVGTLEVGGLAGKNLGAITESYATGNVKGVGEVGGLVGYNIGSAAAVSVSYAKGAVSGSGATVGGLAGSNTGNIADNAYWDKSTSGQSASAGGTGLTAAQMQTAASFAGFNFTSTPDTQGNNWVMVDINGTLNNAGGAPGAASPMLASEYTTRIDNAHQLQLMAMNPAGTYYLDHNIDASSMGSGTDVWGSSGFIPVGSASAPFTGTFDGLLHTVSNLTINLPSSSNVGLIGVAGTGSVIEEVGLSGGSVSGSSYVGALAGKSQGTVSEAFTTGSVSGASSVGGLVGQSSGTMSESYATGSVAGSGNGVGGLVGENNGSISDSYATGSTVGANLEVGGLTGKNLEALSNSYAMGNVKGVSEVGGLVGYNIGAHAAIGTSYAEGGVNGSGTNVGGLVGANTGNIAESYWDVTTSGQSAAVTGATGLTATQMHNAANFVGFNFTSSPGASGNNWVLVDLNGSLNNAGSAAGGTFPMLASEYSTTIENPHQLQLMAMNLGASYTLGQNIDALATGTSADVWDSAGFIPIGVLIRNYSAPFTGTFNGLGHSVSGLTIDDATSYDFYAGLIGIAGKGSVIENIGMVGTGTISGDAGAGALVGQNFGTVTNSYSTVSMKGNYAQGGMVGYNYGAISNSYATGSISNGGGLAATNGAGGTISNSYATGDVTSGGGLVGSNFGTVNNSYATSNVNGGGGLVEGNGAGGMISNSYATGDVTNGGGLVGSNFGTVNNSRATGNVQGNGAYAVYDGGLVGINRGTINQSYATGNVTAGAANCVGGLVGLDAGGLVSASHATGSVSGAGYVGGLAGIASGGAAVSNSYSMGSVTGTGKYVGGLLGYTGGSVANSYATGKVSGADDVGGLIGENGGSLTNTYATGNVRGASDVGGLVGLDVSAATVSGSHAAGSIDGTGSYVGGLIGMNSGGAVSGSDATGNVSGTGYVGGLMGMNSADTVSGNYATGSVSGAGYVGGLVGYNSGQGAVGGSHATGSVSGTGNYVGGLVGYNSSQGTVSSSYATGKVTGASYVGGLVGYNPGSVSISYAAGNVSGTKNVGGLVGDNVNSITNGYATGSVSGSSNVGGLVGIDTGTVNTSYATGGVSGSSDVGGLVGNTAGAGTVTASFWNITTSGLTTSSGGGTGLTTAQMQTQSNFTAAGWNFTNIWYMPSGSYPQLRAFESTQ